MRTQSLRIAAVLASLSVLVAPAAQALDAVAASPDGATVVVGGGNRALWVYALPDWTVARRIWHGARIISLQFTPDGKQLVVVSDDKAVRILSTQDWSDVKVIPRVQFLVAAGSAPVAISAGSRYTKEADSIAVWNTADWSQKGAIALPAERRPGGLAIAADGKTAYVRTAQYKDDAEKNADPGPEPAKWGVEKDLWQAKKDGWASSTLVLDVAGLALTREVKHFDTGHAHGTGMPIVLLPTPKGVVMVSFRRYCGFLDAASGEYATVPTNEYAYGVGRDAAGNIWTGSLASYLVLSPDGAELAKGKPATKLPGWPEYFRQFVPVGAGAVVGVTDGFRAIVIDAATRKVVKEVNCY